ncbi:MAG: tripartite tricarboxylate transporter substrate binding protein [Betaproteobacteria bacterium]|nr:tripartite tricarboxylate transporter substrate binding protein [Betaproteobacteria bacterium]
MSSNGSVVLGLVGSLIGASCALLTLPGLAQSYPVKPVRIVVPAVTGGPTDIPARILAEGLSKLMSQRFIIDNRGGAGGIIGAEVVARSPGDGYTLLYANTSVLAVNPATHAKLPYDPVTQFVPIGFVSNAPQALVANPRLPIRNVAELLAFARANPGRLNFAASGPGSLPHLTYELLKMETGLRAELIVYNGGGPALTAVGAGQSDLLFDIVGARVRSGEVRAIAVTGTARHPEAPDVQTMIEQGAPGVTATTGNGLVGPTGIAREIVTLLNTRMNEVLKMPDTLEKMKSLGLMPAGGSPEDFGAWANDQRQKWQRVVKQAGIKQE